MGCVIFQNVRKASVTDSIICPNTQIYPKAGPELAGMEKRDTFQVHYKQGTAMKSIEHKWSTLIL